MNTGRCFDWRAIHAELDARLERIGHSVEDDPEAVGRLLRQRAEALAARAAESTGALTPVMVLGLAGERYGLPLDSARQVVAMSRAAAIPGAGPGTVGIVNWRGEFVVVFDLVPWFGLNRTEADHPRLMVVLRGSGQRMALAADEIEGIVAIDPGALRHAADLDARQTELFVGVTADAVMVLDGTALWARLTSELQAA